MAKVLPQVIGPGSFHLASTMDGFYSMVVQTTDNVVPGQGIGRDWTVLEPISIGAAGAVRFEEIEDPDTLQDSTYTNKQWVPNKVKTYPGLDEMSLVGFDNMSMKLIEQKGNIAFPRELLAANTLPAVVLDVIELNIQNHVQLKAKSELTSFYTVDDTNKTLGAVSGSVTFASSNRIATFAITSGRIFNFCEGEYVDAYDSTGVTKRNSNFKIFVQKVDPFGGTITVADPSGGNDLSAAGLTTGDLLVIRGSKGIGLQGLNTWIKNTGTLLGISLTDIPRLKSYLATISGVLTESVLNKSFGKYFDALGPLLKYGVTTTEVINKHMDDLTAPQANALTRQSFDRQGKPLDRVGGYSGFYHDFGGVRIFIFASAYCDSGSFYSCITDNGNIRRYVPPRVRGMGSHPDFGSEVEFILAYDTGNQIFGNVSANPSGTSVVPTNWFQAPWSAVFNRMARRPQGIKLSSCSEL